MVIMNCKKIANELVVICELHKHRKLDIVNTNDSDTYINT